MDGGRQSGWPGRFARAGLGPRKTCDVDRSKSADTIAAMQPIKPSPKRIVLSSLVVGLGGCLALFAVSCSDTNTGNSPDLSPPAGDMFFSCCGKPGDPGNTMGIGQYCTTTNDCTNSNAPICANDFYPARKTFFCTNSCDAPGTGTRGCGADATCTKDRDSGLYGCVPTACLTNMPTGCSN
jgi:hypothetical protein